MSWRGFPCQQATNGRSRGTTEYADGTKTEVPVLCRVDTLDEVSYYRHGGILHYVLREMAKAA